MANLTERTTKRLTWLIIASLEVAMIMIAFVSISHAQVRNAPPYYGPIDQHVYFPVTNKGFNYSVTGQQLKDSLGGGNDTTILNGENLQKVTDRGATTTHTITAQSFTVDDHSASYGGGLTFKYPDGSSNVFFENDNGRFLEIHNGSATTDGNPAGWRFYGEVSGSPATIDSNFVTLRQMNDSLGHIISDGTQTEVDRTIIAGDIVGSTVTIPVGHLALISKHILVFHNGLKIPRAAISVSGNNILINQTLLPSLIDLSDEVDVLFTY